MQVKRMQTLYFKVFTAFGIGPEQQVSGGRAASETVVSLDFVLFI